MSPYYNHDAIWQNRADRGYPYWGPQSYFAYRRLLPILQYSCPSGRVLDIGCGGGAFGALLEEHGYTYTGIDASRVAIDLGRKHFPNLNLMHLDFAKPFDKQSLNHTSGYNLATAVNVLHCLVDPEHRHWFLVNMRQMLAQGGKAIITTMCLPCQDDFKASKAPRVYRCPEEIIDEVHTAGFEKVTLRQHRLPMGRNKVSNLILVCR